MLVVPGVHDGMVVRRKNASRILCRIMHDMMMMMISRDCASFQQWRLIDCSLSLSLSLSQHTALALALVYRVFWFVCLEFAPFFSFIRTSESPKPPQTVLQPY